MDKEKNKAVTEHNLMEIEKYLFRYAVYKVDYNKFKQIFKDITFADNNSHQLNETSLFFENKIKEAYKDYLGALLDLIAAVKMEWNVINEYTTQIMNSFGFLCSNYLSDKNKGEYMKIAQEEVEKIYKTLMKGLTNYELFKDTNKTQKTI
ncbi:hypothetical protein [Mycoplasma sp. B6400]|uniref:hypothetical protein n=1 Tax=Mycoplasma sp. B6400 TaxID=3401674 RepID=UPI003AAC44C3